MSREKALIALHALEAGEQRQRVQYLHIPSPGSRASRDKGGNVGLAFLIGIAVGLGLAWAGLRYTVAYAAGEPDAMLGYTMPDPAPVADVEPYRFTHEDVVRALEGQPLMTQRIIFCEVGRSGTFDPYAIGGAGELGAAQLLPGRSNGLAIFLSWGGTDPFDPEQAVWFVNEVQRRGMLQSQYPRTSLGCVGSV